MTITFRGSNTSNINLKQWTAKLLKTINTWIERHPMDNGEGAIIPRGALVYPSGNSEASLAVVDVNPVTLQWIGAAQTTIPIDGRGVIKTAGYTLVMFKDDEVILEGVEAYLSDEPGKATVINGGQPRIGIVGKADDYSNANPFAFVYLRSGCTIRL